MNLCRCCSTDFASVAAFDRHRVGVYMYTRAKGDFRREAGEKAVPFRRKVDLSQAT
jgi:hypothetical protein